MIRPDSREDGVPPAKNWHWRSEVLPASDAVVFDIDGVLANADERQHFLRRAERDWHGFFAACGEDSVIDQTARLLGLLDRGLTVVLLTGRPIAVQQLTIEWLTRHDLRWDLLIMRDKGDYGAALAFKAQVVQDLRAKGFVLQLAVEDDLRNREMFEQQGVPCMYVHSGYYAERDAADRAAAEQRERERRAG